MWTISGGSSNICNVNGSQNRCAEAGIPTIKWECRLVFLSFCITGWEKYRKTGFSVRLVHIFCGQSYPQAVCIQWISGLKPWDSNDVVVQKNRDIFFISLWILWMLWITIYSEPDLHAEPDAAVSSQSMILHKRRTRSSSIPGANGCSRS